MTRMGFHRSVAKFFEPEWPIANFYLQRAPEQVVCEFPREAKIAVLTGHEGLIAVPIFNGCHSHLPRHLIWQESCDVMFTLRNNRLVSFWKLPESAAR